MKRELCICMRGVGNRMVVFSLIYSLVRSAPVLAWFAFSPITLSLKGKDTTQAALVVCFSRKHVLGEQDSLLFLGGCTWMYHQCYFYLRISRILLSVLPHLYGMSYGTMIE